MRSRISSLASTFSLPRPRSGSASARRKQPDDLLRRESVQHVNLHPRKQRSDHFERRIFGGGADQHDISGFDVRQKGVLLRAVEAMHFVHEDDGAPAVATRAFGLRHHFLDFLDAGEHGAEGNEFGVRAPGDDPRERRLAAAGRAPEEHRAELVALDLRAQRLAGAEQLFLADEFVERLRAHAVGERPAGLRRFFGIESAEERH